MSEIEKLYENAGIKPTHYDACTLEDKYWKDGVKQNLYGTFDSYLSFECPHYGEGCYSTCEYAYDQDEYPPFTAEKQLEIIKFLAKEKRREITISFEFLGNDFHFITDILAGSFEKTFEEALAKLVNELWQDLTEEDKSEIRRILE